MTNAIVVPGYFGKIPARGDFLSRRLPSGFAATWEEWLQSLAACARDTGERGWQDLWLTAPLWHFSLGSALAAPHGAAGVLLASADRVGRLFPFTILGVADPASRIEPTEWAREAEALALGALDDDADPDDLDAALAELGPPATWDAGNGPTGCWPVVLDDDWPAETDELAGAPGPGPDQTEWWTRGSDRVEPVRLRVRGFPSPQTARAMLLGGLTPSPP